MRLATALTVFAAATGALSPSGPGRRNEAARRPQAHTRRLTLAAKASGGLHGNEGARRQLAHTRRLTLAAAKASGDDDSPRALTSRDVNRLVAEAASEDDLLRASALLPLAGRDDRLGAPAVARGQAPESPHCGGGARAARGRVLADERFRRCVRLLAEPGGAGAFTDTLTASR